MTQPKRQPPTTAWGALLVAADILEQSAGLTRADRVAADYIAGRSDPYAALRNALWPAPEQIPWEHGGIPVDRTTGRPYWAALRRLDISLGGYGDGMLAEIDRLCEAPGATVASVAAAMRDAARSTTPVKAVSR